VTRQTAPFQSSETRSDPSFICITSTGPPDILVVFEEASDQRLDVLDRAVLVEMDGDNVTGRTCWSCSRSRAGPDRDVLVALRNSCGIERMPDAGCARPIRPTGGVNSLQEWPQPNSGSGILPCQQYGEPKCSPTLVTRLSSSFGRSSDSPVAALSVNRAVWFSGFQSNRRVRNACAPFAHPSG